MISQYIWQGIWILRNSILMGIIIYILIYGVLLISKRRKVVDIKQIISEAMLSIYTISLLKITGIIGMKFYFWDVMNGRYNLSLILFEDVSLIMLFLNLLLFVPYGILLPCVFKNLNIKKVVMIGFFTSLSIEVTQLFGGRYTEIDDLIINTLGTLVGFIIYSYTTKKQHKKRNKLCCIIQVTRKWVKEMKLMYNILVVDDDKEIVESIEIFLKNEGYNVYKAYNGMEALDVLVNNDVHLILMDIMMPKLDGIKATIKIREEKNIPIILVSAKSEDTDKIMGLNIGADDYITKPFNLLELIARVKSNLRRYVTLGTYNNEKLGNNEVLISGGLELNTSTKEVKVDGQIVRVTPIEFKILNLLIANKGRVFSIDEIYEKVWNEESFNVENTVAVHIRRIRGKIEINPKEPRYLKVVWGVGYKIEKL